MVARPRLQGGADALGRDDHRQDGQRHHQDDRRGHGAGDRLHRRADGARAVGGGRARALPPRPAMSDEELFEKGYNRVYDTLEMEANLNYVEEFSSRALDDLLGRAVSSEIICRALGKVARRGRAGQGRAAQRVREGRARLRARVHRLRAGPRPLDLGDEGARRRGRQDRRDAARHAARATTRTSTSTASRASRWARSGSASSPSAAACRATGRRRSGRTSTS